MLRSVVFTETNAFISVDLVALHMFVCNDVCNHKNNHSSHYYNVNYNNLPNIHMTIQIIPSQPCVKALV
jgi:hypothetical protein